MRFEAGKIFHVYNRGNNQQRIFFERENYLFFLRKVRKHVLPHGDLLAYCLMPNHFHFLIVVKPSSPFPSNGFAPSDGNGEEDVDPLALNLGIAVLLRSYTQAINKQYQRTGSLFQQKTKAKYLTETADYAFICFQYIHQNPLRAGLVAQLEAWEFSSFNDYAGFRAGTLCNQSLARELLDLSPTQFYQQSTK
jgi:putative transposase